MDIEGSNHELQIELLRMRDIDQEIRTKARENSSLWDPEVDLKHTERMKEIIEEFGWPGKRLVGMKGAEAAWLLVQHADHDRDFQKKCLSLLKEAVKKGEAEPSNLAYLVDRLRVAEGQPQIYGTQFFMDTDGKWKLCSIEDEANVDQRRASVGLDSLAEYVDSARPWLLRNK